MSVPPDYADEMALIQMSRMQRESSTPKVLQPEEERRR